MANDFKAQQQAAVERMREMNSRRQTTEQNKKEEKPPQEKIKPKHQNSGLSFLDSFLKDGDSSLIIGLLLILMSEKADKMLLFALIYILI